MAAAAGDEFALVSRYSATLSVAPSMNGVCSHVCEPSLTKGYRRWNLCCHRLCPDIAYSMEIILKKMIISEERIIDPVKIMIFEIT